MAAPLEWVFKLTDRMSGPAKQIAAALAQTEVATKATEKATATLDKTQAATTVTTKALETAQVSASSSAKALASAQTGVAESTERAGKATEGWWTRLPKLTAGIAAGFAAVSAAAFGATSAMFEAGAAQDKMNRAFAASLGGGGKAAQSYLRGVAGSTELTRPQLEDLALPLARQGFKDTDLQRLIPAALDVQAQGGDARRAIEIFSKIASTGTIEGEAFGALNLKAESALLKIGERVGLRNVKDVKAAIEAGQIKSDTILEGVLASIAGSGMLGDKAVEAAKSPAAALNRFRNIQETVLSQLAESKALPELTRALDRFTAVLTSQAVVEGVTKFFDRMATALTSVDWARVGDGVVKLIEALASIAPAVLRGTVAVVAPETPKTLLGSEFLGKGLERFVNYTPMGRLGNAIVASLSGAPSANDFVMRADGSVLNIDSQDALVGFKPGGPIDRMMGAPSSIGGGVTIEAIHVNVSGGGSDPEETGARLAASIRAGLIAELDRMAIEVA